MIRDEKHHHHGSVERIASTPGEGGRVGTSPAGGGTAGRPAARPRRRGGGPEASSATATIVAVTMSDSAAPAGSTAAEHWHRERRRVRQPQVDGREPRGPARAAGRARDGADRARVVAEDDAPHRSAARTRARGVSSLPARPAGHPATPRAAASS